MTEETPKRGREASLEKFSRLFDALSAAVTKLYAESQAARWGLALGPFRTVLERSARKRFAAEPATPQELEQYLSSLHLEDLALASACALGCESAWEHFFSTYRPYLRAAAAAILRRRAVAPEACELADALFTDLYGLGEGPDPDRSLFRYFHGRSSLKTWLRAVLAQRHIDSIRVGRRFEEFRENETAEAGPIPERCAPAEPEDPYREHYVSLFCRALRAALERLPSLQRDRLRLYYAEEKTLAEIGRLLGEHESSVSRHLERVRGELRQGVEQILRSGFLAANGSAAQPGLSDAEIELCFAYSAENAPLDLDKLLPRPGVARPSVGKRT